MRWSLLYNGVRSQFEVFCTVMSRFEPALSKCFYTGTSLRISIPIMSFKPFRPADSPPSSGLKAIRRIRYFTRGVQSSEPVPWAFLLILYPAAPWWQARQNINVVHPSMFRKTQLLLYTSSHHQVFISSWDRLNIFDGQETRTYRPLTHHMAGIRWKILFMKTPPV